MILLTLASKQIWPQVLAVAHLRPGAVVLLHSADRLESLGPAQRLKRLFDQTQLVPQGHTRLEPIPHDDFPGVERALDRLADRLGFDLKEWVIHFTGGNKLMATAAFRWSTRRGVRCFYLERGNLLTWFTPRDGDVHTQTERLDGHVTDGLDPVALLRCQMEASEVERPGQTLTLNPSGRDMTPEDFFRRLRNGQSMREYLEVQGRADSGIKEGDALEWAAAAALLKLGVGRVQRSLRLKVRSRPGVSTRSPHAEIDLLFNWNGRLWLVDCKDQRPMADLVAGLRRFLPAPTPPGLEELLIRLTEELAIGQTKALKLDLLAVREVGGLLGQIVCIRKSTPTPEVMEFARHYQINVVAKTQLVERLRELLQIAS